MKQITIAEVRSDTFLAAAHSGNEHVAVVTDLQNFRNSKKENTSNIVCGKISLFASKW